MVDSDNAKSKRDFRKLSKCMGDKLDKEKGRSVSSLFCLFFLPFLPFVSLCSWVLSVAYFVVFLGALKNVNVNPPISLAALIICSPPLPLISLPLLLVLLRLESQTLNPPLNLRTPSSVVVPLPAAHLCPTPIQMRESRL